MLKKILVSTFLILLPTVLTNAASLPWAEYGASAQNTGQSPYVGPQTNEYSWKALLEGDNRDSFVSPVIDGSGTIYALDDTGRVWGEYDDQGSYVYNQTNPLLKAFKKTGVVKWTKEVDSVCKSQEGITSVALGTNGLLYLACGEGIGYSFTTEQWGKMPGKLYGIEVDTGRTRWELTLDGYVMSAIGGITVDSLNRVYFVSAYRYPSEYWPSAHAITAVSGTGTILWNTILGDGGGEDIAGPVLSPDHKTLYVYRRPEGGYVIKDQQWISMAYMDAISTDTGQVKWELPLEWGGTGWQAFTSFATDANGTIWMASYRKPDPNICYGRAENLVGISPDGNITHQLLLDGDMTCGSHVRVGPSGTVYITHDNVREYRYWNWFWDGDILKYGYAIWDGSTWIWVESPYFPPIKGGIAAYDPVNGFKWRFELPDSCEANASPAIDANENIYFAASYGEKLYSINKDGQLNWEFNIAPGVEPSHCYNWQSSQAGNDQLVYGVAPAIGLNGSVYFMGEKNLYGIDTVFSEGAVINIVQNLAQSGRIDAQSASVLIGQLDQISISPTASAKDSVMQTIINEVNALESSGRIDTVTADQLTSAIGQLYQSISKLERGV